MPKYFNPTHKPTDLEVQLFRVFGYRTKPQFARILQFLLQVKIARKSVVSKQISVLLKLEPSSVVLWIRELEAAGFILIGRRTRKGPNPGCALSLTPKALTTLMHAGVPMSA